MSAPDFALQLAGWWGGGVEDYGWAYSPASNLVPSGNPIFQISDFLAFYPQFGTYPQSILGVQVVAPGIGYQVGDMPVVVEAGGQGGTLTVTGVNSAGGITFFADIPDGGTGTGYWVNSGIQAVAVDLQNPGAGYVVGDMIQVLQNGALNGVVQVAGVSYLGAVLSVSLVSMGSNYATGSLGTLGGHGVGLRVNVITGVALFGGSGLGALVNITQISPFPQSNLIPQVVLQTYINLAQASLQYNRWFDTWAFAMCLYVAHFVTLYAQSRGGANATFQQIAAAGLQKGIATSKSVGDVSQSVQLVTGLDDWGAWNKTDFGVQLATFAQTIGMGGMYVY